MAESQLIPMGKLYHASHCLINAIPNHDYFLLKLLGVAVVLFLGLVIYIVFDCLKE